MYTENDIEDFFDKEHDASKADYSSMNTLSIDELVQKRKAIKDVFLDTNFENQSELASYVQLGVSFRKNISDFKEGQPLELSMPGASIPCTLVRFEGENYAVLEVFFNKISFNFTNIYKNISFVLKPTYVDLRRYVYYPFCFSLRKYEGSLGLSLFSYPSAPVLEDYSDMEYFVEDAIRRFGFHFEEQQREAICKSMAARDYYLVQGPPGTGKSYVLSLIIKFHMVAFDSKVAVIAPNHKAINNVLEQFTRVFDNPTPIKIGRRYNAPNNSKIRNIEPDRLNVPKANDLDCPLLFGLTPHALYNRNLKDLQFDVLIIDEAGQMSIPLALMGMIKAKKVILAGDSQQLSPIVQSDKIPAPLRLSAFKALMTSQNCTTLDVSFRMCKPICDFVSDLFYDGIIQAKNQELQTAFSGEAPVYDFQYPVVFHSIQHQGKQSSEVEANYIVDCIEKFISLGLEPSKMAVLAPFRAQCATIRRHLYQRNLVSTESRREIVVDTIDKMQGQEREVIFVSLTVGEQDYFKDMIDFVVSPNKLNVAFSRAKFKLIVVGNFNTIAQARVCDYPHVQKMMHSSYIKWV